MKDVQEFLYNNGQVATRNRLKDGLFHGVCNTWFEDGTMNSVHVYENGDLCGMCVSWRMNRSIINIKQFKKHLNHGILIVFYYEN